MNITFKTLRIMDNLNNDKYVNRTYGPVVAKVLKRRLVELRAAQTLKELGHLPPARCHELKGDRAGQLSVDLPSGMRLVFEPSNELLPLKGDGGLDWSKVTDITIIEVVNYHD